MYDLKMNNTMNAIKNMYSIYLKAIMHEAIKS